jgi:hypothetical protein
MSDLRQNGRTEPRWPPALAIIAALGLVAVLPHHVQLPPWWVPYLVVFAVLLPMAAVTFTKADAFWLLVERRMIMLFAALYIINTAAELADMIGIITLHPPETRQISLLSSSLVIWVTNVLSFSLVYWQIDAGGPSARGKRMNARPDWLFPQAATPEASASEWTPTFLDYLFLGYNTATAFSPTDAAPLTGRAKMLMMLESAISLLTLVIVAARAINVLP